MNKSKIVLIAFLLLNITLLTVLYGILINSGFNPLGDKAPDANAGLQENVSPTQPEAVPVEPESIELSVKCEYITVGTTMKLEAKISPSDAADAKITWTSDNGAVASVGDDGTVKGIAKGVAYIKASADNGVFAVHRIYVMNPGLVFLSPSRQIGNPYYNKMTDECTQAFLMSGYCKERLEAAGLEVYECPTKYELESRGKLAADMGAKCYVAIHTNAGGNDTGTMSFYNRRSEKSIRLAMAVYDTVAPITPDADAGVKNGVKSDGKTYKEIEYPYNAGVPSTLLEVDFHDKEKSARWLMNNSELIGYSIADGILLFMYENY